MKKGLLNFCLFAFCFLATPIQNQAQTANPKMDAFIMELEQTKFIKDYKRYRNNTESRISLLKANTATLDPKAVAKLRAAYKQSQFKFDEMLDQLKRDVSTTSGRKRLVKNPNIFSTLYQRTLDESKLYCDNEFNGPSDRLLGDRAPEGDPITMLIFSSLFELFKAYMDKQTTENAINAVYLDTKFIEPLRFRAWDKVTD